MNSQEITSNVLDIYDDYLQRSYENHIKLCPFDKVLNFENFENFDDFTTDTFINNVTNY